MSGRYSVHITRNAYSQMKEIRQYIEEELYAPAAAKRLLLAMKEAIKKLDNMPARHDLVEEEPWRSEGVRRLIVRRFYIYFWIDESTAKVYVTAVVYEKRDQIRQLSQMDKY